MGVQPQPPRPMQPELPNSEPGTWNQLRALNLEPTQSLEPAQSLEPGTSSEPGTWNQLGAWNLEPTQSLEPAQSLEPGTNSEPGTWNRHRAWNLEASTRINQESVRVFARWRSVRLLGARMEPFRTESLILFQISPTHDKQPIKYTFRKYTA